MTVRLSVGVMAHPSRRASARRLAGALSDAPIVYDPEPGGPPSSRRAARAAWGADLAGATHRLVIQDDAVPMPWLLDIVHDLVALVPNGALSLFTEWSTRSAAVGRTAALCGFSVVPVADPFVPTVAAVLPAEVAGDYARYGAHPEVAHDDVAMYEFLRHRGTNAYACFPNLVEHSDLDSIVGYDRRGTVSVRGLRCAATVSRPGGGWRISSAIRLTPYYHYRTRRPFLLVSPDGHAWQTRDFDGYAESTGWPRHRLDELVDSWQGESLLSLWGKRLQCDHPSCVRLLLEVSALHGVCAGPAAGGSPRASGLARSLFATMVPGYLRTWHAPDVLREMSADLTTSLLDVALDAAGLLPRLEVTP